MYKSGTKYLKDILLDKSRKIAYIKIHIMNGRIVRQTSMESSLTVKPAAGGRNYRMDNIKCILIFSVVFGHMLELYMGNDPADRLLYLVIYSFHMPLFAFVTGIFARYDPARIRNHMIYPYLVFQTLYLIFANRVLEKDTDMQYTTPYWILWYLLAIIIWNLVLPLVQGERASFKKKAIMLAGAMAAGVLIGFDTKTGYYLSFSRVVEFFPYFLMGVYYRQMKETLRARGIPEIIRKRTVWERGLARGILTALICMFLACFIWILYQNVDDIRSAWLYGSVSYEKGDYTWQFRVFGMMGALAWMAFFLLVMPGKRLPYLSYIGANTMTVYLLHGFVIKYLNKIKLFKRIEHDGTMAVIFSILLVMLLSWKPLVQFLKPLFCWKPECFRIQRMIWKRRSC